MAHTKHMAQNGRGERRFRLLHAGFSLIEMLFYIALLSLCMLAVMRTLVAVTNSYRTFRSATHVEQEAAFGFERMVREIRDASGIDDAGSTFGSHPGKLLLSTTDVSGTARTVEFSLSSGLLKLAENRVTTGFLTSTSTTISNLVFRKITTARSKGVKIEMTMQSGTTTAFRSENFYVTAVLRDSY